MRVLVVTSWYPTFAAPAAGVFLERHVGVLAADHDVRILHLGPTAPRDTSPRKDRNGVRVDSIPTPLSDPRSWIRAAIAVRRAASDADVVHSMAFPALLLMGPRRPDQAWVHSEHWSGVSDPRSVNAAWAAFAWLRHAESRPDVVTVVSEYLGKRLQPFRRSGPVLVVPNVVPVVPLAPARPPHSDIRLVAVGGLTPVKDPFTAVRCVAVLRARGVPADMTWIGDGPLRAAAEDLVSRLDLADRFVFTGTVPPEDVSTYVGRADMLLQTSRHETFCVAAAEALAVGRPVVVGATGGQAEFVSPDVGALVSEGSPEGYADAVQSVARRLAGRPPSHFAAAVTNRFGEEAVRNRLNQAYHMALRIRRSSIGSH